ncbi:MAG: DUF427 domain-containing protein [Cyanobacteria bacterium K_DeepCast_35m_m2_023]|nr:DUF427 domain-containing protein [Cyanobacteria bacterium K_DeepCast_35m_m2_023]
MAERVADYPRPPALRASHDPVRVEVLGQVLCDTDAAGGPLQIWKVCETFHPPTVYLPPAAMRLELLEPAQGRSFCEWKGVARYFGVVACGQRIPKAVWHYPEPTPLFAPIAGWFALYPGLMEAVWLAAERVTPQPGGFYGGWITSQVEGPFKGDPRHPELI